MQNIPSSLFPRTEGLTFGDLICRDKMHFDSALQKLFSDLVDCHRTTHAISMQKYPGVLPRRQGAPLLAAPWICSVSHKYDRAVVAVGCGHHETTSGHTGAKVVQSVGIDLEEWMPAVRAEKVARRVLGASPLPLGSENIFNLPQRRFEALVLSIVFSAKEALFKCLYPIVKRPFYFEAAQVTRIDFKTRAFCIALTTSWSVDFPEGFKMTGSFAVSGAAGNILTDQHIQKCGQTTDGIFVNTALVLF